MFSLYSLVPEWHWNSDDVSAIATAIAAIIALFSSSWAIWAPQWERASDRSEATHEVLRVAAEAIKLFNKAKQANANEISILAAESGLLWTALDRLLNRTSLTDGAIITGAGAMQLLKAIEEQNSIYSAPPPNGLARRVQSKLTPYEPLVKIVMNRAQGVARYAVKRRWPKWNRRFKKIAEHGLGSLD